MKIRDAFPMLQGKTMQGNPFIYFDSAATSLKPNCVIQAIADYYQNYCANVHRGDYDIAAKADQHYENARLEVANFIHANENEIVFTSGTTQSLNLVALGYALNHLQEDDEIILNETEHASNLLPWYEVARKRKAKIVFAPVSEPGIIKPETIEKMINEKTKIISIAHISNVLGYENDVKSIIKIAHQHHVIVCVDAAQSVPHQKIDVKDMDCDFLAFSGHKMCGPTGIGVLYGKYELLEKTDSIQYGGGMNSKFDHCLNVLYKKPPFKFEGGTPNIDGAIGLAAAIRYLNSIGMDQIAIYEKELKSYAIEKLKKLDNIEIYNASSTSAIITFNIKGVFCQDAGSFFNYKGIAVRSGHHCAKLLPDIINTIGTVRASLYFYNTKEEIDRFVEVCKNGGDFLDAFFK